MKQIKIFTIILLLGVCISACQNEPIDTEVIGDQYLNVRASLDEGLEGTKTFLDDVQVKWEASDTIALWYGVLNSSMDKDMYTIASIDEEDAREATFHGFAPAGDWTAFMGVYPYSASNACSKKGKLTVTLPTVQTATSGGFGPGANVAVAYSATTDLAFKNIGALMAVTLTDVGEHVVNTIRLTGTAPLSGQVGIKQATLPAVDAVVSGVNYVDLTGTFAAGNTYYFVVLPGEHTGFTLTLTDSEGNTATATSEHAFRVARNSNTLIANLTVPEENWVAPPTEDTDIIVLNEISGNGCKFIELYNAGETSVSLTGWTVQKDESVVVWTGTTESLDAGAYLVLYSNKNKAPDANPAGAITFSGGLSAKKNVKVDLYNASGVQKDSYARGEVGSGWGNTTLAENTTNSFSRVPNGSGDWKYAAPTPGAENGEKTGTIEQYPAANGMVILNEVNGNTKFIELYSTATDQKISLEDMTIKKDGNLVWTGAPGYAIEPGGYVLLYSTDVSASYPEHDTNLLFSSGLSSKKAVRVQLYDNSGASLNGFNYDSYSGTPAPASYGRNADGVWYLQAATPGAANTDGDTPVTGLISYSSVAFGNTVRELSGLCLSSDGSFLWGVGDEGNLYRFTTIGGNVSAIQAEAALAYSADMEGVTVDSSTGDLYVAVEPASVYKAVSPYSGVVALFDVAEASGMGGDGIEGIAWHNGELYIGAQSGATLWCYGLDGAKLWKKELGTIATAIEEVGDLFYDSAGDRLWVADSKAKKLFVFDGDVTALVATYDISFIDNAESVCVDRTRHCVWLADDNSPSRIFRCTFPGI